MAKKPDQFARFTAFRPPHVDPRMPMYCPDRDFGQVQLWLSQLYHYIKTADLEPWKKDYEVHHGQPVDYEVFTESLGNAFLSLVTFMEDAAGADIAGERYGSDPDSKLSESQRQQLKTYRQALDDLFSYEDRAALLVVLQMLGVVACNCVFYAVRQDRQIGRQGPMTFSDMWPITSRYALAITNGVEPEEEVESMLDGAVTTAVASGWTERELLRYVERVSAKTSKDLR